jgi:hypothetical protein
MKLSSVQEVVKDMKIAENDYKIRLYYFCDSTMLIKEGCENIEPIKEGCENIEGLGIYITDKYI